MNNPSWMSGRLGSILWITLGALTAIIILTMIELRVLGKYKFACKLFGHAKPVYHISRAFWWCSRCGISLGINKDLWTPEAMLEHAEMMRRPDRN